MIASPSIQAIRRRPRQLRFDVLPRVRLEYQDQMSLSVQKQTHRKTKKIRALIQITKKSVRGPRLRGSRPRHLLPSVSTGVLSCCKPWRRCSIPVASPPIKKTIGLRALISRVKHRHLSNTSSSISHLVQSLEAMRIVALLRLVGVASASANVVSLDVFGESFLLTFGFFLRFLSTHRFRPLVFFKNAEAIERSSPQHFITIFWYAWDGCLF